MGTLVGTDPAEVLAHAGGWDELLFVLAPLVLVAGLLLAANRRAKRLLQQRAAAAAADPVPTAGPLPPDGERPGQAG